MRLVIVSNRLPIVVESTDTGPQIRSSSGGLVSALEPILQQRGGLWIGWPGAVNSDDQAVRDLLGEHGRRMGFGLQSVQMSHEEEEGFYQGFCNEIIWPLFHDLQTRCNFVPDYWTHYLNVTRKFTNVVLEYARPDDFLWVQDYHLLGLGQDLRQHGLHNPIGFFLHIPFPPPDIFCKLPWRTDVLDGLLRYDVIGFHTPRDRENFLDCVRALRPMVRRVRRPGLVTCEAFNRVTKIGVFPIGIDYARFSKAAATESVTTRVKELRTLIPDQQIILGLDRLDYTKGIPYRLRAFHQALKRYPDLHRKVTLLQVVVPSREAVPEYQDLKAQIERQVTQINGEFTQPGWVPIHHVFRSLDWEEMLAYYRAADVGLVTPLKDGMNLVAKEYCACQVEGNGVLILSEFAGAAVQMRRDAVLVNPYDVDHVAEAIHRAALMTPRERRPAMKRLRMAIRRQDVYWWVGQFLSACGLDESRRRKPNERSQPILAG